MSPVRAPIGLSLLAGDVMSDVTNAIAARVDYIVLEMPATVAAQPNAAELDWLVWSVVAARSSAIQSNAPAFPIYVDAPLLQFSHIIKLFALGATAVTIDAISLDALPPTPLQVSTLPKGLLSGIGTMPNRPVPNVEPFERAVSGLLRDTRDRLRQQQLRKLGDLNREHLRALSEHAARIANVKLLSHD